MIQKISYAQNAEDIFLHRILGHISNGFYIDLGAAHPFEDSVTALFYLQGWRGINVEPDRRYFGLLTDIRDRDINLNICIGTSKHEQTLFTAETSGWSTTQEDVAEKFKSQKSSEYKVPTQTLESIFDLANDEIHFLKIDCEGAEIDILHSSHFVAKRPWVIAIEIIEPHSHNAIHPDLQSYLESKNYKYVHFDGLNGFFIDNSKIELLNSNSFHPVSVLDGYITFLEYQTREKLEQTTEKLEQTTEKLDQTTEKLDQTTEKLDQTTEKLELTYKSLSWRITFPMRLIKQKTIETKRAVGSNLILVLNDSRFFQKYLRILVKRNKKLSGFLKKLLARARINQGLYNVREETFVDYFRDQGKIWQKFNNFDLSLPNANQEVELPLLSICISTYNRANWLTHSVPHLMETIVRFNDLIEVLIVDNASTDGTKNLLGILQKRYKFNLITNPINVGMLGNLEITANAARGEFTWILGDDDFINPSSVEDILKIIWKHPGLNLIYGNYSHINFNSDQFTNYEDILQYAVLVEPESESYFVDDIVQLASKTENFFTAIYCTLWRTDHARKCFQRFDQEKPFESLEGCVPTTNYVLNELIGCSGYWYGKNLITVNTNVSWLKYADLWVLDRLPEIYNRFENLGVSRGEIDKFRLKSINGVMYHLEDAINKESPNIEKLKLNELISGYLHLPEFSDRLKDLNKIIKKSAEISRKIEQCLERNKVVSVRINVQGPFIGSYSLARVNRGIAKGLSDAGNLVNLTPSPTEGPDFMIPLDGLDPQFAKLYAGNTLDNPADFLIRDTFPPTTHAMNESANFYHSFGWEESEFPTSYVLDFNEHLDGITVMSSYVKKVLMDNGVKIPIEITGLGVDHISNEEIKKEKHNNFRFLSVSSAFPRKGIDLLIQAFVEEFDSNDNVELILKSFPNVHNNLENQIAAARLSKPNYPKILLINEDWKSDIEIAELYRSADVVVAPSRGEGFGWSVAEALLYEVPVIATGFGGHLDILDNAYPWFIDYQYQYSSSHFDQLNSLWVEPNLEHLKELMRTSFNTPIEIRESLAKDYKDKVIKKHTWENSSHKLHKFMTGICKQKVSKDPNGMRFALVTTWKENCGIAQYSEELLKSGDFENICILARKHTVENISTSNVFETWQNGNVDGVIAFINQKTIDILLIQYHPSFYDLYELGRLVMNASKEGIRTFIIVHNVLDFCQKLPRQLQSIFGDKLVHLMVHTAFDLNRIKKIKPELLQKVIHFPHPNYPLTNGFPHQLVNNKSELQISTFGFLHENKGVDLLIHLFAEVKKRYPDAKLNLINAYLDERSTEYKKTCMQIISEKGLGSSVNWYSNFLTQEEVHDHLKFSDLVILPYRDTAESSSGAVRMCMASQIPILVSKSPIFSDLENVVRRVDVNNFHELSKKVFEILENPRVRSEMIRKQNLYVSSYDFETMSKKLRNIVQAYTI